jgi:mono/diheme cytochrome c family protein
MGDSLTEYPVWVGELPNVEWSEIEALSQEHCLRCHGGETLTDLTTAEGWEQRIERIIELVTAQDMPLDGEYLSDEEIILIRAWKHGGFQ